MIRARPVAVEPPSPRRDRLRRAVEAGGGRVSDVSEAEALVWADAASPEKLPEYLAAGPHLEWVGLPFAGIENYAHHLDRSHVWTCARGVYAAPVAEHILALALAGMRGVVGFARARSWPEPVGVNLIGANVTVFGGGGITEELLTLLAPFGCRVTVVRRTDRPTAGADRVLTLAERMEAVEGADLVVLALALTPETRGIVDAELLERMPSHAWLVNVARGGHVDQEALLNSLRSGGIGGAALDVTTPEPLPPGHPLWGQKNVVISPHVGNTPEMGLPLLVGHVTENVGRFCRGDLLDGIVDVEAGY